MIELKCKNFKYIIALILLITMPTNFGSAIDQQDSKVYADNIQSSPIFIGQPERYFEITKTVMPKSDLYSANDTLTVLVEIKNLRYRDFEEPIYNLSIYEIVDHGLIITEKATNCKKISSIEELEKYKGNLFKNDPDELKLSKNYRFLWNENDNIGHVQIDKFGGNDRLVYWYNITPTMNGIFDTKTTLRTDFFSDIEQTMFISVAETATKFDISLEIEKPTVIINEPIDLDYYITYSGGAINRKKVLIKLDPSNDNRYIIGKIPDATYNLSKYEVLQLKIPITFLEQGTFLPPGIQINGFHYSFNDKITVKSFF